MDSDPSLFISFAVLFSAFAVIYTLFVVASVALNRSTPTDFDELEEQGVPFASVARRIIERSDYYILSCQLGQLVAASSFGWFFYGLMHESAIEVLFNRGKLVPPSDIDPLWIVLGGIGAILVLALLTFTLIQIAKAIVGRRPEHVLCLIAWPIVVLSAILAPIMLPVRFLSDKLLGIFNLRRVEERHVVQSAEDISEIVARSSEAGEIDDEEREMIEGVFAFSDTIVAEVMTPRKDVAFVKLGQSLEEVVAIFKSTGFSRLLVCGVDLDDIQGVLLLKDLLPFVGVPETKLELTKIMRSPYFCSSGAKIDELLEELRSSAVHLAVVRDEHGGVDGVVTLEDLVEEIVGDILDEFDIGEEEKAIQLAGSGDLLVDGSMTIYDLNHIYELTLPEGEYTTIAGFVMQQLGKVPERGETFSFEGLVIKVERMVRNRVRLLRITQVAKSPTKLKLIESRTSSELKKNESSQVTSESKEREKSA